MRKLALIVFVALIAVACGQEGDGDPSPSPTSLVQVTSSPSPSASVSPTPTGTATAAPTATASATTRPNSSPSSTTAATASPSGPAPATRESTSVNCSAEPKFCSGAETMVLSADRKLQDGSSNAPAATDGPNVTMTTQRLKSDGNIAQLGDVVSLIRVSALVKNNTGNRTFVFPKRQATIRVLRNGDVYDELTTDGSAFEMTPGSSMTAKFDIPITNGGTFGWQVRTWYYQK